MAPRRGGHRILDQCSIAGCTPGQRERRIPISRLEETVEDGRGGYVLVWVVFSSGDGRLRVELILARRSGAGLDGGAVHVCTGVDEARSAWTAVCGIHLVASEAECVDRFTGAPCTACLLSALEGSGSVPAGAKLPIGHPTTAERANALGGVAVTSVRSSYAVGLRDGAVHRVGPEAARGQLEGHAVIQALCGHLGWEITCPGSLPGGGSLCEECRELQG
jgi:hypothetical protein